MSRKQKDIILEALLDKCDRDAVVVRLVLDHAALRLGMDQSMGCRTYKDLESA